MNVFALLDREPKKSTGQMCSCVAGCFWQTAVEFFPTWSPLVRGSNWVTGLALPIEAQVLVDSGHSKIIAMFLLTARGGHGIKQS